MRLGNSLEEEKRGGKHRKNCETALVSIKENYLFYQLAMYVGRLGGTSKKNRYFWGFFPKGGGGHPISQNFCTITKSFLACQIHPKIGVFQNRVG